MNDFFHSTHHGEWLVGLEDVTSHVDSGSSALDGFVAKVECLKLRELFTTGDDDGDGASCDDVFEAFSVVSFDDRCSVLSADA